VAGASDGGSETVLLEIDGPIGRITLNRPEAANALTLPMCREFMQAAIRCDEAPGVRAILLTGAGDFFCGGGDLKSFADMGAGIGAALKEMTAYLHAGISRLARTAAPVVTAVNGVAAGAGMSLAAAGDLVIASEKAKFAMAYTAAGLSPDGSSSYFLPRLIGMRRTQELMLTNRRLSAQEALEWGLVNRLAPVGEVRKQAEELAQQLADGPTLAFGVVKKLLATSFSESLETQMEYEAVGIAGSSMTQDGSEGIRAFLEKRTPAFSGG
jgi:2-(1,2-epoxy-1,2-dihydrophenyl)acetyl-CoA isomerase